MKIKAGLAALLIAGAGAVPAGAQDWARTVAFEDGGHVIGNPEAETRIVEFMSYTCSHCAKFAREGEPAIRLAVVPTGNYAFEIRHLLRDPVDLSAALLAHCGDPAKFLMNHTAILARFEDWMERAQNATDAQKARWSFGSNAARRRAIASDLGFTEIMESRGYSRVEIDRCLSDETKASAMVEQSQADMESYGVRGTPSFAIDGELLDGVHSWQALEPVLRRIDLAKRSAD